MVKKHSVSDTARTASLTNLRRWPGDGVFGQKKRSRNSDLGAAQARQAGGFYAGQVVRPGSDDDPPCWEPSRKRGWASQYSLGEPVLRGRWASQHRSTLGELASNRAGRASIEDWASIKHGCSYWRLLSAAPLAQWTQASATCSVAPNLAPPHLLSGRGRLPLAQWHQISHRPTCSVDAERLPLAQWHQISHRPTCSVDAGVCHLLSGTKFAPAPLVQWMLASPTCSVAPSRPPHELTAALPGRSASRRQLVFFFTLVNVCVS